MLLEMSGKIFNTQPARTKTSLDIAVFCTILFYDFSR